MARSFLRSILNYNPFFAFKSYYCSSSKEITAGIIILGDEILNGQTEDTNSSFFIKKLNQAGIKISKVSILPDDVDVISKEVSEMAEKCSVVLTSGEIGPTHDDLTYEAVALALREEVCLNQELVSLFREYFGPKADGNPAVVKFPSIPKSAQLNFGINKRGEKTKFPLISAKNIYMFPGVPGLLEKAFEVFKSNFIPHNEPLHSETIFVSLDEFSITPVLNETVNKYKGSVKFGSYPAFDQNYYKVKLVLEGSEATLVNEAANFLKLHLPDESIVTLNPDFLSEAPMRFLEVCRNCTPFETAQAVTEEALAKYSLSEVCICFNGGKDCTALLHLLYCCVSNKKLGHWGKIHAFYVKNGDTFQEVEKFIQNIVQIYKLDLTTIDGDLKEASTNYLKDHPYLKAIFLGTRRGDPGSQGLTHFSTTDQGWPSVMRVLPVLDWSYSDVWNFIREQQVPYCTLYDRGYTSLGLKSKTRPNPKLLISHNESFPLYKPAYMLQEPYDERHGRL